MYGQNAEELVGEHISGADRFNIVATCIGKTVLQIFFVSLYNKTRIIYIWNSLVSSAD